MWLHFLVLTALEFAPIPTERNALLELAITVAKVYCGIIVVFTLLVNFLNKRFTAIEDIENLGKPTSKKGKHAVVLGGSFCGMVNTIVLLKHFDRVTILDRDQIEMPSIEDLRKMANDVQLDPRRGVPQGSHVHLLLGYGYQVMCKLLPEFEDLTLELNGRPHCDLSTLQWYMNSAWLPHHKCSLKLPLTSRPTLEMCIRYLLNKTYGDRIEWSTKTVISTFIEDETKSKIVGVEVRRAGAMEKIYGDLIVDCMGKQSPTSRILKELQYGEPEVVQVAAQSTYCSRLYSKPANLKLDDLVVVYGHPPKTRRGALLFPSDANKIILTCSGIAGVSAPQSNDAILPYLKQLDDIAIYDIVKQLTPVSEMQYFTCPPNTRRHFERMARWPQRFIASGDAVMNFNPIYGQGMSVSVVCAVTLDNVLRGTSSVDGNFSRAFQKQLSERVEFPWMAATHNDYTYPETTGPEKDYTFTHISQWYFEQVVAAANSNLNVRNRFIYAMQMVKSPLILYHPVVIVQILKNTLFSGKK